MFYFHNDTIYTQTKPHFGIPSQIVIKADGPRELQAILNTELRGNYKLFQTKEEVIKEFNILFQYRVVILEEDQWRNGCELSFIAAELLRKRLIS